MKNMNVDPHNNPNHIDNLPIHTDGSMYTFGYDNSRELRLSCVDRVLDFYKTTSRITNTELSVIIVEADKLYNYLLTGKVGE